MSLGSTTEYVQRKLPASGWTVTDTGRRPALADPPVRTTAAPVAAATTTRRAIQVRRIMLEILRERRLDVPTRFGSKPPGPGHSPIPSAPRTAEPAGRPWT